MVTGPGKTGYAWEGWIQGSDNPGVRCVVTDIGTIIYKFFLPGVDWLLLHVETTFSVGIHVNKHLLLVFFKFF
jgi:hypothetical protein